MVFAVLLLNLSTYILYNQTRFFAQSCCRNQIQLISDLKTGFTEMHGCWFACVASARARIPILVICSNKLVHPGTVLLLFVTRPSLSRCTIVLNLSEMRDIVNNLLFMRNMCSFFFFFLVWVWNFTCTVSHQGFRGGGLLFCTRTPQPQKSVRGRSKQVRGLVFALYTVI